MAINGCLTLAWLEEDDPSRGFFRVQPAALIEPEIKVYAHMGEYGDEDFLRVVPDKNEMSTFKQRMRTLGRLCLIDLRAHPRENDKIRQNKNYLTGNDKNPYMIYSDVICGVPDGEICHVTEGENALTRIAFKRSDASISGPYRVDGDVWTPCEGFACVNAGDIKGTLLDLTDGENSVSLLFGCAKAASAPVESAPVQTTAPAAQEKPTPKPEKPQKCIKPEPSEKPDDNDSNDTRERIDKEVSCAFKRLKEQMGLNPRKGRSLSEVVDEQWRMRKQDELGQTVPPQATSEPVLSPAERAISAINEAWDYAGAQAPLVEGIIKNDELKRRILEICAPDEQARPTDARLIEQEAERLKLITEMDGLKRRTREMKAELLREMRASNEVDAEALRSSIVMLETEAEARRDEIESLKRSSEELKSELRRALGAPISEQIAHLIAQAHLKDVLMPDVPTPTPAPIPQAEAAAPMPAQEPIPELPPIIEPDAFIDMVSLNLRARGWQFMRDDIIHMLTVLALDRPIILTGFAGSDDMRFAEALSDLFSPDAPAECVRLNTPGAQASMPRGRCVCSILDHPDGAPLDAATLDGGFLLFDRAAICLPSDIAPMQAIGEATWLKLLCGELSVNAAQRLNAIYARLTEFGARIPHGAIADCARYIAATSCRMSGGEGMAFDYALATRLLPPILAAAPRPLITALPDILGSTDMCARLLKASLPVAE